MGFIGLVRLAGLGLGWAWMWLCVGWGCLGYWLIWGGLVSSVMVAFGWVFMCSFTRLVGALAFGLCLLGF